MIKFKLNVCLILVKKIEVSISSEESIETYNVIKINIIINSDYAQIF